ncbi:hypothetical protein B0H14DRAFT_2453376 [Mycena olivaceomarginata]|nr:hypothetical protein B0H14DRAFT_2453376 [Mycena olivaceomarginata]
MSTSGFLVLAALLPVALGQLVWTNIAENHPALTWQRCNRTGGMRRRISLEGHSRSFPPGTSCTTQSIDSNWLWTHRGTSGTLNWYTGLVNTWDNRSVFRLLVSVLPAGLCPTSRPARQTAPSMAPASQPTAQHW